MDPSQVDIPNDDADHTESHYQHDGHTTGTSGVDHGWEPAAVVQYDSADCRQQMIAHLQAKGIPQETIDVRMRAYIAHGRPAGDAIRKTPQADGATMNSGRKHRAAERPDHGR